MCLLKNAESWYLNFDHVVVPSKSFTSFACETIYVFSFIIISSFSFFFKPLIIKLSYTIYLFMVKHFKDSSFNRISVRQNKLNLM